MVSISKSLKTNEVKIILCIINLPSYFFYQMMMKSKEKK